VQALFLEEGKMGQVSFDDQVRAKRYPSQKGDLTGIIKPEVENEDD
jgi:hypothetical protein